MYMEKIREKQNPEEKEREEKKMFSILDLEELTKKHKEEKDKIWDADYHGRELFEKLIEEEKKFLEELMESKERFKKIFKTEKESIYFILETGESLRFKRSSGEFGEKLKSQPVLERVFFISEEEAERIKKEHLLEWPGGTINIINYRVGAVPFELNVYKYPSKIVFKEEENSLKIIGSEFVNEDGKISQDENLSGGYHIGHPITEIIR